MSVSSLGLLAAGERAGLERALQSCWLDGFGGRAFGTEDIAAAFRRAPSWQSEAREVATEHLAFAFGASDGGWPVALVAELNAGWITRLWRLGPGVTLESAPATSVPVDLDRDQRGGALAFDFADHPALSDLGAQQVRALGETWLCDQPAQVVGPLTRARPLVLRAASEGARTAALFRIEGAAERGMAGFHVAALIEPGAEPEIVVDAAGREAALTAPWTPQLRDAGA